MAQKIESKYVHMNGNDGQHVGCHWFGQKMQMHITRLWCMEINRLNMKDMSLWFWTMVTLIFYGCQRKICDWHYIIKMVFDCKHVISSCPLLEACFYFKWLLFTCYGDKCLSCKFINLLLENYENTICRFAFAVNLFLVRKQIHYDNSAQAR